MSQTEKFSLVIPSVLDKLEDVEQLSEKVAREVGMTEDDMDNMAIAVTEAVNNAIKHGNNSDESKKVFIEFLVFPNKVTIKIKDQGTGFDPRNLKNPLDPENLLKESGRGIFILKALMDEVDFNFANQGTEIILSKKF